ncbi:hypothetical protein C2U70_07015 [Bradyrhizobium guangdongense]|uniref:hypothetical protein n=1 Tax=Bradyrhizobium guangdongense TaxID=1325090 RepID=UPI001129CEE9|nr:hypothetical protein [Bradyrhizobium guangdongense]TPQ39527.1 hypothetical protein C2U70_07015 [Bradyrhizobium guangdongense]
MMRSSALPSQSINEAPNSRPLVGGTVKTSDERGLFSRSLSKSFEERIDDALVQLKAAVAQYAMHLPAERRQAISDQLENIINVDDWYDGDEFPDLNAFKDLLAWSIYAEVPGWDSLGVDDEGDVLIAWHRHDVTLTANFDGHRLVRWTSRYQAEGDTVAHASGDCSLRQFARQAKFYLHGGAINGD